MLVSQVIRQNSESSNTWRETIKLSKRNFVPVIFIFFNQRNFHEKLFQGQKLAKIYWINFHVSKMLQTFANEDIEKQISTILVDKIDSLKKFAILLDVGKVVKFHKINCHE